MRRPHLRPVLIVATLAALFVLVPSSKAAAQTWVNAKGELALSLRSDYQTSDGVWHGSQLLSGFPVRSLNDALAVEYVPLDKLALGLTLSGNGVAYKGPQMPSSGGLLYAHGSQDDGSYHWNLTDLDFDARYQVYDGPITLTPVFRARIPVTDYESLGYANAGSHLPEAGVGFHLGRYGLGVEDLVLQASYVFTFVGKYDGGGPATEQYRVNRSDADLSLSYVFSTKFIAGVGAAFRFTHDGFSLANLAGAAQSGSTLYTNHDPVLQAKYLAPAAVASYQVTPTWSVAGRFAIVAWGENVTNAISFGLTLGWENNLIDP